MTSETATATEVAAPARKFESQVCGRCGGSGHFSSCAMYGTTCFKCRGAGRHLTKRGEAANKYLTMLRSKPAHELVVGDAIYSDGQYGMPKRGFYTITAIEACDLNKGMTWITCGTFMKSGMWINAEKPEMVRVMQTAEQSKETFAKALAYEDTLLPNGKPRKR